MRALLAILLLPVASACSFAGDLPPPPAGFVLTDLADGTQWRVNVEARQLGGTCELSNPHALAGGWFAWVEGGRLRMQELHADAPSVDVPFETSSSEVAMFDLTFLALERERMRSIDLATGAQRDLPLPAEGFRVVKGSLLAYQDGIFGPLSVYDARSDEWLVRDRAMPELDARWWPWMIESGWLVLHSEPERGPGRYHLMDLVSGELRELGIPSGPLALDGALLYYLENGTLVTRALEGGAAQEVAVGAGSVADVVEGIAIEPVFSLQGHAATRALGVPATETMATPSAPGPASVSPSSTGDPSAPVPSALWLIVAAATLAAFTRRR